jgi:glutaredoxin-like protein NrdH
MIEVYCMPGCVQCEYTKKKLEEYNIPYQDIDVTMNTTAYNMVQSTGNMQMPMVVAGNQSWHGFQYDKIRAIADPSYAPD